jgi:response regulator RpfG family c-di-GMP phosphodiesterase
LTSVAATGAHEALRLLGEHPVEAAVVHIELDADRQLESLVRRVRERRNIGVVLVSAGRGVDALVETLRLGAVDCVMESSDPADMADAVWRAVAWGMNGGTLRDEGIGHVMSALDRRRDEIVRLLSDATTLGALQACLEDLYRGVPARLQAVRRIASAAVLIAEALAIDDEARYHIQQAALLHDLGGLVLAEQMIDDGQPWTGPQAMLVSHGAAWTVATIDAVPRLEQAARAVDAMRECFDGSGVPRGLSGAAIPVGGRVLAVACAFESLISTSSSCPGETIARANAELVRGAGRTFDPSVVRAWLAALDGRGPNHREVS